MNKPTNLVFQCPDCGGQHITVCELREVWYNCTPKFDIDPVTKDIAPCYDLEDNLCAWPDGAHHSTYKFACATCHRTWLNTQEMYKDEALIELKAKKPKRIEFVCPHCGSNELRRRWAAFEIYDVDALVLQPDGYFDVQEGSKLDVIQATNNPAEPEGLVCPGCKTCFKDEDIIKNHWYKDAN